MKLIRIGNDIQINWTITRFGEPEDFENKNLSVALYDKFNNKQIFDYTIEDNKITGTFYGKDQTTNGVYRLFLVENEGKVDMVSLDYIDCFCISNKLKNQTSNGEDSSNINTEVVEVTSDMNTSPDLSEYARKTYVDNAIDDVKYELENEIPTKTSQLTNDSGFLTQHQNLDEYAKKSELFSRNYNDLTNKPTIPTKTSQLTNDSGFLTQHQDISGKANVSDVNTINSKIPTQASAQNQLADKSFVNSSINTATAEFKGTVNSVYDLSNLTADNNDYAFVIGADSAGNTTYNRYKYNGSSWIFEYTLNNSSFTANQWAAIQSNITSSLVTKLNDLPTNSDLTNSLNNKVDKVTGKGLSTNDYTTTEKNKLNGIESGAQVNVKPDWNATSGSNEEILNKPNNLVVSDNIRNIIVLTQSEFDALATYDINTQYCII